MKTFAKALALVGTLLLAGASVPGAVGAEEVRKEQYFSVFIFDFCQGTCDPGDELCCIMPE